MEKPIVYEMEFFEALKESIIEITGDCSARNSTAAEPVVETAGKLIQVSGDYFISCYGIQSARGLLIRTGRSAAGYLWRNHHKISALGSIEKRLLPIHHRFEPAVNEFLSVICPEIGLDLAVNRSGENEFLVSFRESTLQNRYDLEYVLFLLRGMLEAFGNWLDSRKDYSVTILGENERQIGKLIGITIRAAQ
jgi:hypothetical protein